MADLYEIRKGVPLPTQRSRNSLSATIRKMAYGDSIVIPAGQHLSVHTIARSVGAKVKTSSNGDGTVTVWRIAPDVPVAASTKPANAVLSSAAKPKQTVYETTVADPALGLPAGYYIQEPYGPRIWIQGRPPSDDPVGPTPTPTPTPAPATVTDTPSAKKTIFD